MKKVQLIVITLLLAVVTSCHRKSNVVIKTETNGVTTSLEYSGNILLNRNNTLIKSISPNGYIIYNENGSKISVTSGNDGQIYYQINNAAKTTAPDSAGKTLLAHAVIIIAKQQGRTK